MHGRGLTVCGSRSIFSSVADPDPFGSVSFWSAGSASMKRIRNRVAKYQPKSWKISTKINANQKNIIHFFKTIKLIFTDINIYPINNKTDHISEKYILDRKKNWYFPDFRSDLKQDLDPLFHATDPRIRIHIKMKRIRNTDF